MEASGLRAEGIRWDLSELYAGPADPRINEDLAQARRRAEAFAEKYRAQMESGDLDGATLAFALREYEALSELGRRPSFYASLFFAADTQNACAQDLVQRTREACTEVENLVVFFELGLIALDEQRLSRLLQAPEMAQYAHYVETLRRFKPHALSEKEEKALNQKNLTGRAAFEQLYTEVTGALRFKVRADGEEREVTEGEALALLRHPDRALRDHALAALLTTYAAQSRVLTPIFNNLLLDHRIECDMRAYPDLVLPTHLANQVAPQTVETMMEAVERHYALAREYFALKARLLGLEKLAIADLYAPLGAGGEEIPFSRARAMILAALGRFSPAFAAIADGFFRRGWIDAEVRASKQAGAFCAALAPGLHPYILCSYNGTRGDVRTLAHELGHGIHYSLSGRQSLLSFQAPLVLAETASVFAELVQTHYGTAAAPGDEVRRALLCDMLEEAYGTIFRQTALTRFEMAAHAARREQRLSAEQIGQLWWREQQRLFADSVEVPPLYRWGWAYIPHFIHSRFYCYSYAFGHLLTLALFQRYLDEGRSFVPGYLRLLEAGGSQPPERALARLGIDINRAEFWDQGFRVVEGFLAELRRLV